VTGKYGEEMVDDVQTEGIEKRNRIRGQKYLKQPKAHQFLGMARILHVELPTLIVCLASLRAKSMSVGTSSYRGADAMAKRPSTGS
jgi:hypothetical protein